VVAGREDIGAISSGPDTDQSTRRRSVLINVPCASRDIHGTVNVLGIIEVFA
jgi:hypothetical protein